MRKKSFYQINYLTPVRLHSSKKDPIRSGLRGLRLFTWRFTLLPKSQRKTYKRKQLKLKWKRKKISLFSDLFNNESVRMVNLYLCNTISGHTAHFSSFPNPSVVRSTEHLCFPEHLLWLWLRGETLQRVVDSANIACKMATLWLNTIDLN